MAHGQNYWSCAMVDYYAMSHAMNHGMFVHSAPHIHALPCHMAMTPHEVTMLCRQLVLVVVDLLTVQSTGLGQACRRTAATIATKR